MGFIFFTNVYDNIYKGEIMNILERIKQLCNERNWTIYKLAEESGITQSTITNMFYRKTFPSLTTLMAICDAFGITPSQFFNAQNTAASLSSEEESIVNQYRKLNKKDKQLLQVILNELTSK